MQEIAIKLFFLYIGGVIALLFESLIQWMYPHETNARESTWDALFCAFIWPMMAGMAVFDFLVYLIRKGKEE